MLNDLLTIVCTIAIYAFIISSLAIVMCFHPIVFYSLEKKEYKKFLTFWIIIWFISLLIRLFDILMFYIQ